MIYVDASILLEIYLGQPRAGLARQILADEAPKISSWLLAIEVPVALRRVLMSAPKGKNLLQAALARFDADQRGIALYEGLPEIAERVRHDPRLSRCRALDALHVATALQCLATTRHGVRVATFDGRLAEVAGAVGLEVWPAGG